MGKFNDQKNPRNIVPLLGPDAPFLLSLTSEDVE